MSKVHLAYVQGSLLTQFVCRAIAYAIILLNKYFGFFPKQTAFKIPFFQAAIAVAPKEWKLVALYGLTGNDGYGTVYIVWEADGVYPGAHIEKVFKPVKFNPIKWP